MPTRAPRTRARVPPADDASARGGGQRSGPADAVATDATPSEQRATATWVEAADASGTVRSKREMPEPDSPGG